MAYVATLIRGDGIGPEVIAAALDCIAATGVDMVWEEHSAGERAERTEGTPLPAATLESIRRTRLCLKGPLTTPIGEGYRSVNVTLRQALGLFANVRPVCSWPGVPSRCTSVDLVLIRENTEDLYAGIEFDPGKKATRELLNLIARTHHIPVAGPDTAVSIKMISDRASRRIASFAFHYALDMKRRKITAVHKANIMKSTDGIFLRAAREVAALHSNISFEDRIVDNMSMQLVEDPSQFDVILAPNLYGDILSDLCAGLAGGLGLAPAANIGMHAAIFEPVHGSAPRYAGRDKANPGAAILAGALLLDHVGEHAAAHRMRSALGAVLKERRYVTYDIAHGRSVGTKRMARAIVKRLSVKS